MKHMIKSDLETVQAWLMKQISSLTGLGIHKIMLDQPLADYGLDSIHAIGLSGDIEDWSGLALEPTIVWDYPTIEALSQYLIEEMKIISKSEHKVA